MGRIIAIANQKGGVGKTTTAINLSVALAEIKQRVLLIDLDPQGNATSGLSANRQAKAPGARSTIYDVLIGRSRLLDCVTAMRHFLFLARSSHDLVGAEVEMANLEGRERRLRGFVRPLKHFYNYVLIDTPPSLGLLTVNALVAADSVLIPLQCEYYALEGLSALLNTIARIRQGPNPALEIEGILLTMFDSRNRLSHEVARNVRENRPSDVLQTIIPRNVRLSESPSHGLSVLEYESRSVGAQSYRALAQELLSRNRNNQTDTCTAPETEPNG